MLISNNTITRNFRAPPLSRVGLIHMFMDFAYFPGDEVINVLPHYTEDQTMIVKLNAIGIVRSIAVDHSSVTVSWETETPGHRITTIRGTDSITPATLPELNLR